MNIERLTKLVNLLKEDANNPVGVSFDMSAWIRVRDPDENWPFLRERPDSIPVQCDTQACAFGLAAISGIFAEDGLTYQLLGSTLVPEYQGQSGFDAACVFFEISTRNAVMLFDPAVYDIKEGAQAELEVVKRIDVLMAVNSLEGVVMQLPKHQRHYLDAYFPLTFASD